MNRKNDGLKLSIKVFSGITFQPILPVVTYFLLDQGVNAEFEIGDYDQVHAEIGADAKQSVSYDYIYFHTSIIKYFSRTLVDVEGEGPRLAVRLDEYLDQIERIARSYPKSKVVINLLECPPFRARGTLSRLDGGIAAVHDVNQKKIIKLKESYSNILIHDLNYVSAKFGLSNFFDFKFWAAYKQPFASDTAQEWADTNLHAVVAMAIFDMDIYKPTKAALEAVLPRLTKGSVLVFDEFNDARFPGETQAVSDFLGLNNLRLRHYENQPNCAWAVWGE